MSVATLNTQHHLFTIGASHSYCFYQELSVKSCTLRSTKQIIPSTPRQHFKAPRNHSLSPIRSQKVMPKTNDPPVTKQRPYPLMSTFSSPAIIETIKVLKQQKRRVSFDEKVVVVCTIFDEEFSDNDDEVPAPRRHSTGEPNLKSILIHPIRQQQQPLHSQRKYVFWD